MDSSETGASRTPRSQAMLVLYGGAFLVVLGSLLIWRTHRKPHYQLTPVPALWRLSADDLPPGAETARELTVDLVNTGRRPIEVSAVESSCHCTAAVPVTQRLLAPGERTALAIRVQLPAHGTQRSIVRITTKPPSQDPVSVFFDMSGRMVTTPLVNRMPRPTQLVAHQPGEPLEHQVDVETLEEIGSEPWLRQLAPSDSDVEVTLLGVRSTGENISANTVTRLYGFRIRLTAPARQHAVRAFSLTPVGANPAVRGVESCPIRVCLSSPVSAVPERLLMLIEEDTQFPVAGTVDLVSSRAGEVLAIREVATSSDWIDAQMSLGLRSQRTASEGGHPTRIEVQVHGWPTEVDNLVHHGHVDVTLSGEELRQVHVPVILVDRRAG